MEKSLVRQFTGVGASFFGNTTKNGFIRTFHDENDLAKSTIKNLPSYKKDDLSKRLDMVVIFQSIEIQRLSLQIESLRVQLKDSQRQLKNYISYQIQIKELTQQCSHLEEENYRYKEQIEKMNMICQKMYSELQQMHQKYDHVDLGLEEKLKKCLDENKSLKMGLAGMERSFNQKAMGLSEENKKLAKKVTFQENQIHKLQDHIKKVQQSPKIDQSIIKQLNRLKDQQKITNQHMNKLFKDLQQKSNQLQNLKTIIKSRLTQNEVQKSKALKIQHYLSDKLQEIQRGFNKQQQKYEKEMQSLMKQNQMLNLRLIQRQEQFQKDVCSYQQKMQKLSQKMQQAQSKYQNQLNELKKLQDLKTNQERQINAIKQTLKNKDNQFNNTLRGLQNSFGQQITILNRQKQILEQKLMKLLKELDGRSQELNNLKGVVINIKKSSQKQLRQKERNVQQYDQMIKQMEKLYVELDKEKNRSYEVQCRFEDMERRIQDLEGEKELIGKEYESLLQEYKKAQEKRLNSQSEIRNMVSKYEKKLSQQQKALSTQRQKLSNLSKDYQSLKQSHSQLSNKAVLSNQQLSQLKVISSNQSSCITQLLKRIENSQRLLKQMKNSVAGNMKKDNGNVSQQINMKLNEVFKVSQGMVEKIIKLQDMVALLQNQNFKLESEKKLLNFEMVQTHKINSMQKRRDSRASTDSSSLKSFINTNSMIRNKDKFGSFIKSNSNKQSLNSVNSQFMESEISDRRIFTPLVQNR